MSASNGLPFPQSLPPIVGEKNMNKFTPQHASLRTGQFTTVFEIQALWNYRHSLPRKQQFGIIIDDRVFEDNVFEDKRIALIMGFGASFMHLKGNMQRSFKKVKFSLNL